MEKKRSCVWVRVSTILWGVLAILLCGTSFVRGDVTVPSGQVWDIDYDVGGFLYVYGTANVLPGAHVAYTLDAYADSTVNIYGGQVDMYILVATDEPAPILNVYGTDFQVGGGPVIQPPNSVVIPAFGALTGKYEDGSEFSLTFVSDVPINLKVPTGGGPQEIDIDIKPGSYPNAINLGSNGVVPVAILSSDTFVATTVDPETVFLAGSGVRVRGKGNKYLASQEDVNGDGLMDLVVKVETENLELKETAGVAILTGQTVDGVEFTGSDEITIVPPDK